MKQYSYSIYCLLIGISSLFICGSAIAQNSSIELTIRNTTDTVAYLGYHFADKKYILDTAHFDENQTVKFHKEGLYKPGLYFYYTPTAYFEFIVNEAEIILETEGESYVANLIVIKSEENRIFNDMQKFVSTHKKDYLLLQKEYDALAGDSTGQVVVRNQMLALDSEVRDYQDKLAIENEGTFVSRFIRVIQKPDNPNINGINDSELALKRYQYYKNHFFDGVNIADADLLRTPVLNQKINEYLDKVVIQNPDSLIKEVDFILGEAKADPEVFRYALVTVTGKYENPAVMGLDRVFVHLVENYYLTGQADWVDQETLDKMSERIATMKPNFIGNAAPALVLNDTLFTSFSLYDVAAEYTVLYFYDPDCGHCKKKTPVLYDAYANLRTQNVEILAICTTTDTERWKEYIRENDFDWINLADSFSKTYFRYYYDIRTTPTIYILDKDKKIIAKKLDASQVESFIMGLKESGSEGD